LTPLFAEGKNKGKINFNIIPEYAAKLENDGVTGLFLCGTTSESYSFSVVERKSLLEYWLKVKPKFSIIVHVGATCVDESRELSMHASSLGVDGIATMPPIFFKPRNLSELGSYLSYVASASPQTPFFYYHFPIMTGVNFQLYDILVEAEKSIPNLKGAKFTSVDTADYQRCQSLHDGKYDILYGYETTTFSMALLGGRGAVGACFSAFAPLCRHITDLVQQNDLQQAKKYQLVLNEFVGCVKEKYLGVIPVFKALMKEWHGLDFGNCRLPNRMLTEEETKQLLNEKSVQTIRSLQNQLLKQKSNKLSRL